MIAKVVFELKPKIGDTRLAAFRGLALQLKSMRIRFRDLDTPNGYDALFAIAYALPIEQWKQLADSNVLVLGERWGWVVNRAGQHYRDLKQEDTIRRATSPTSPVLNETTIAWDPLSRPACSAGSGR